MEQANQAVKKTLNFLLNNDYYKWVGDKAAPKLGICEQSIIQNVENKVTDTISGNNFFSARPSMSNVRRAKANVIMGGIGLLALALLRKNKLAKIAALGIVVFNIMPGAAVWAESKIQGNKG